MTTICEVENDEQPLIVKLARNEGTRLASQSLVDRTREAFEDFVMSAEASDIFLLHQVLHLGFSNASLVEGFMDQLGREVRELARKAA